MAGTVDQSAIRAIAKLANLSFSAEELASYEVTLGKILAHMDEIKKVSGPNEAKLIIKPDEVARERIDRVVESLSSELALAQAPAKDGHAFQVPKIIETEE